MENGRECTKCKTFKQWQEFNFQSNGLNGRASVCKECRRAIAREKYARTPRETTPEQREKLAEMQREARWRVRCQAMEAYGGVCACCGEAAIEFLNIDHVNGGGNAHRRSLGCKTGGHPFYAALKRKGYPFRGELRVLCANCNAAYGHYGYCPHGPNLSAKKP